MAHFINSFGTNKIYRQVILGAEERLVLLMPFLKLSNELQSNLDNIHRRKLDVLFVYSLSRLEQGEVEWLKARHYIRVRQCPNLYMRCCLSEKEAFISSKGPYRLNTNRYDMGFHVSRDENESVYRVVHDDVYRIVGDSRAATPQRYRQPKPNGAGEGDEMLSDWVIAERMRLSLDAYYDLLEREGYLARGKSGRLELTAQGEEVGGKPAFSQRYGPYFMWPRESGD